MSKIRIKQIKSTIKYSERQQRTIQALGLNGIHKQVEKKATPQILGMIEKVKHLVSVEEIK